MTIDAPSRCHIPALWALWREAFGDSEEFLDAFAQTAFSLDRCRCIMIDDSVVAALYWLDCSYHGKRVAYLYAIATATAYRGRGYCSALMHDAHRHLKALGYAGAILVPGGKALFAFYEKIGYRTCSYMREICCSAAERDVELRTIDKTEYTHLRRQLLPRGGVIQEDENLDFLQTMASFYAGNGFLLAARRERDFLYGVELLGRTDTAPAIVRALACTEGRFRTPGTELPFAMYHPLDDHPLVPPSYFGLAFD